jgi:hypothetical protein
MSWRFNTKGMTYPKGIIHRALYHVGACQMHHCIDAIFLLCQCSKIERLVLSRPACSPCDIDCEGFEIGQAGDPQEEVAEALNTVGYQDGAMIDKAYLVRSWWKELKSIERPLDLLKLLYELHVLSTEESNVILRIRKV